MVMGEITTNAYVDIQKIVRETVREIGYDRAKYGFDCDTCGVVTRHRRAVHGYCHGRRQGPGSQGEDT